MMDWFRHWLWIAWRADLNGGDRGCSTNHPGNHLSINSPQHAQDESPKLVGHFYNISQKVCNFCQINLAFDHASLDILYECIVHFIKRWNIVGAQIAYNVDNFLCIMMRIEYNKDYCLSNIWKVLTIPISNFWHLCTKHLWIWLNSSACSKVDYSGNFKDCKRKPLQVAKATWLQPPEDVIHRWKIGGNTALKIERKCNQNWS